MGIAVAATRSIPWSTEDSIFPQAKVFLGETVVGLLPEPSAPMQYMNISDHTKGTGRISDTYNNDNNMGIHFTMYKA